MPGLWKAWKAKNASHSFHEPLGNLAKGRRDSHIPTAPTAGADGKVENQKQISHFSTARGYIGKGKKQQRGRAGFAPRPSKTSRKETFRSILNGRTFRLIPHWNQFSISCQRRCNNPQSTG